MGLRPAHTCRRISKQAYTRYSKKIPRKSYVKSLPHCALQIMSMGNPSASYSHVVDLVAKEEIQIRDNALEAARQAINKHLEAEIPQKYHFIVRVLPHHVVRVRKIVFGAGADRIQKGMKHAWGKPSERAARIRKGDPVYSIHINETELGFIREAYRRARSKLPGKYNIKIGRIG